MECPPAPMKRRVRRCVFDDPEHICVRYIETKVYDSGHVENISCQRVYRRREDVLDEDVLYTATKMSYLGLKSLRALDVNNHAIAVYDRRINNRENSSTPDVKFHQIILIKE